MEEQTLADPPKLSEEEIRSYVDKAKGSELVTEAFETSPNLVSYHKFSVPVKGKEFREFYDFFLLKISEGCTLNKFFKEEYKGTMYTQTTLFRIMERNATLREQYNIARRTACERFIDEMIDISDNPASSREAVARDSLRVKTRQFFVSKLLPEFKEEKLDDSYASGLAKLLSKAIDKVKLESNPYKDIILNADYEELDANTIEEKEEFEEILTSRVENGDKQE